MRDLRYHNQQHTDLMECTRQRQIPLQFFKVPINSSSNSNPPCHSLPPEAESAHQTCSHYHHHHRHLKQHQPSQMLSTAHWRTANAKNPPSTLTTPPKPKTKTTSPALPLPRNILHHYHQPNKSTISSSFKISRASGC